MKEFIVKMDVRLLAEGIDDALDILGHHLIMPDDEAYQFLSDSKIDIHPLTEEDHV